MSDDEERERLVRAVEEAAEAIDRLWLRSYAGSGSVEQLIDVTGDFYEARRALRKYDARQPRGGEEG